MHAKNACLQNNMHDVPVLFEMCVSRRTLLLRPEPGFCLEKSTVTSAGGLSTKLASGLLSQAQTATVTPQQ